MPAPDPDAYALLETAFSTSPKLRHQKQLPRRSDEYRTFSRAAAPLTRDLSYTTTATEDETESVGSIRRHPTPIASPGALSGTDSGLPPTPPTISQDGQPAQDLDQSPRADNIRNSFMSQKSSLSTPVNARSPPTPDPSPPRTGGSSNSTSDRPPLYANPSSRAESFTTAREDSFSSEPSDSRAATPAPVGDRLSTVEEDRGLGLAFEHDEDDVTPTNGADPYFSPIEDADTTAGAEEDKGSPMADNVPDREWNTDLMRNITIRRKRNPISSPRKDPISSPRKDPISSPQKDPNPRAAIVEPASPAPSTSMRRTSGLRERVEVSNNSPVTPSIENFAQSIGWPSEDRDGSGAKSRDASSKRFSTSSVASTVVEARVVATPTPPRTRQTLRHSGRNMAYRRDISSPAELGSTTPTPSITNSSHTSFKSDDVPLHRLVHKRTSIVERNKRFSVESSTLGYERTLSPSLSVRQRTIDSSAHTLAHQESIRRVLQPAAESICRSNSATGYHKRNSSAPEPARRTLVSSGLRNISQLSPPGSPQPVEKPSFPAHNVERAPSPSPSLKPPTLRKEERKRRLPPSVRHPANANKSLSIPDPREQVSQEVLEDNNELPPSALMDRVRRLVSERDSTAEAPLVSASNQSPAPPEYLSKSSPSQDSPSHVRRGSRSSRGRSGERRRSSNSQDHTSLSPDAFIRPSLDRLSTEEIARHNHEWRRPSEEYGQDSFDMSLGRSEEHAMARHLYSQTTPFSQFSDTLEVSEATAVSIFPHNNHSLLVVQQVSRGNSLTPDPHQVTAEAPFTPEDHQDLQRTPTPPFEDASEGNRESLEKPTQPTLNFEPSTPPMQFHSPQLGGVDSPLTNPRPPPEPPKINFIPPTPLEELDRQLVPGPPDRSDSYPQRRLTLAQRARRYSGNLITPILARASTNRVRYAADSPAHSSHRNPRVPTVNAEDGTLHPFWRPRGFWDGFDDDSDSESGEDDGLPEGGDTSDVEEFEPPPPRRTSTLGKRLTNGIRGSGGFLIGNSLGVERHGTNKRRHHVTLPPHFSKSPHTSKHQSSPKVQIRPPTTPLGAHGGSGITKRGSRHSSSSESSYEPPRGRTSWRQGRSLPGLKKYQVQYIGLTGVKERLKERTAEKRRAKIRRSIGTRCYVEPASPTTTV